MNAPPPPPGGPPGGPPGNHTPLGEGNHTPLGEICSVFGNRTLGDGCGGGPGPNISGEVVVYGLATVAGLVILIWIITCICRQCTCGNRLLNVIDTNSFGRGGGGGNRNGGGGGMGSAYLALENGQPGGSRRSRKNRNRNRNKSRRQRGGGQDSIAKYASQIVAFAKQLQAEYIQGKRPGTELNLQEITNFVTNRISKIQPLLDEINSSTQ